MPLNRALEIYRRRHGGDPRSLDGLSPNLLPSVPRDRITGSTVCYLVDGDEAVVYSIGRDLDLDDDGGVLPKVAQALVPAPNKEEYPEQREKRLEYNRMLESGSTRERKECLNNAANSHREWWDRASDEDAPNGDWVLWHSGGWPVEREAVKSRDD